MARTLVFVYGAVSYLVFLVAFLYAIGFVGNVVVAKSIDSGAGGPLLQALLINMSLLALFAIQHSVMARPAFKMWWTKIVPRPAERSTFVLLASLILLLLFWRWRPIPGVIWDVGHPAGRLILDGLFWLGWLTVLVGTFLVNHFDLFGLRQVYLHLRNTPYTEVGFRMPGLYKFVRHPIMLGFIIAFWATPRMTAGHLLFAVVTSVYILIALQWEERDLETLHGEKYRSYRREVSMLLPMPRRRSP